MQPGTTSTMGTAGDPGRLHKERVAPPFSLALSVPVLHPVWLVKRCISFLSCGLMYLNLEALHWCPWSKPVNVETWGHVSGPIVMAHALAELRYGIVAHRYESGFKCGYISAQTL